MTEPVVLTPQELTAALADLPGWRPRPNRLHAAYRCASSATAIDLVAAIGAAAEDLGHHPDLRWSYRTVIVRTTTHDAGDQVTALDVALAERVGRSARALGAQPLEPVQRPVESLPPEDELAFPLGRSAADESQERELYLDWLRFLRGVVLRKADGLTEEQARTRPDGHGISVAGLLDHLTHVEWRWIDGGISGEPVSRDEDEFSPGPERRLADLVSAYRERARRTDDVVRAHPLSTPCMREPGADLRWVLLHLVNETARHAGHADLAREFVDGTTGE